MAAKERPVHQEERAVVVIKRRCFSCLHPILVAPPFLHESLMKCML